MNDTKDIFDRRPFALLIGRTTTRPVRGVVADLIFEPTSPGFRPDLLVLIESEGGGMTKTPLSLVGVAPIDHDRDRRLYAFLDAADGSLPLRDLGDDLDVPVRVQLQITKRVAATPSRVVRLLTALAIAADRDGSASAMRALIDDGRKFQDHTATGGSKGCAICSCVATTEVHGFPVCAHHAEHGEDSPDVQCPTCGVPEGRPVGLDPDPATWTDADHAAVEGASSFDYTPDDEVFVWSLSEEHARRFFGFDASVPIRLVEGDEADRRRKPDLRDDAKLYAFGVGGSRASDLEPLVDDGVQCRRCGGPITDVEHDDSDGVCPSCQDQESDDAIQADVDRKIDEARAAADVNDFPGDLTSEG